MAEASPDAVASVSCHLNGITRLCFTPDGRTIFTGGSDCLVRIHKADDPASEPGFHDNHTDAITSLSCSRSHLFTASLDNIARVFSYPQNEYEGFVTRFSGVPMRWVASDPTGERVAVCGDDLLVKIVHVKDTDRVSTLMDHTKAVRSATWDPQGKYLTTVCCDGKVRLYDISMSDNVLMRVMDGVIGSSESDSTISCYAAWHPSGLYFAIPTRTNEIAIFARDSWTKKFTLSADGPKSAISELAWSANGQYLASSSGSQISVWSKETQQVIAKYNNTEGSISGLSFSPTANLIAFTSLDGSFGRWTRPVPSDLPDPVVSEAAQAKKLEKLLDDDFGDGPDDEDMDDKGEDLEEGLEGDDWIVDDDGAYADDDGEKMRGGRTEVVNVTKAQPSFSPGSTSYRNKKRYLAFNMIGAIDVTDQETHNVVNVEFHDRSTRRGYHFQDHAKFSMASLGEHGIVYGSASDGGQSSSIHYRPYDSWASQSDWTMQFEGGEDVTCVAVGGAGGQRDDMAMGSVIVATSKGYVRFLSSSGMQRYMWRVGEEVVTIAAGVDSVMIVHREGGTSLDGCQNLRYSLIGLDTFDLLQQGRVPLPKKSTLSWIGFTPEGSPAMFDSIGLLSILDRHKRPSQARWVPLLDSKALTKKEGRTESYWPVGLTDSHFSCVILKGTEKEPWFPRPLVQEVEIQMPLLALDTQQGKLEESAIRGEMFLSSLQDSLLEGDAADDIELSIKTREVALDKALLQLVQGACKADNLQRALDVTRLMHNPATVEAAAKVAAFYHLPGLQERIQGVKIDVELQRGKRQRARRSAANGHAQSSRPRINGSTSFGDFAPKQGRRSFGGVQRDVTPAASTRGETFIPETPGIESTPAPSALRDEVEMGSPSPDGKRKRVEDVQEEPVVPRRKVDEFPLTNGSAASSAPGAKNPFAKKAGGGNPFAKPAVAKPLDAIKSQSFFERVDNIESSGTKTSKSKGKAKESGKANASTAGGKQTTLFGGGAMKKTSRPPVSAEDSMATVVGGDEEDEETQGDESLPTTRILEESHVQETLEPEEMDVA